MRHYGNNDLTAPPGNAGTEGDTGFSSDPLPNYSLLSMSHVLTGDAQRVVLGLVFPDKADADTAIPLLQSRLDRTVWNLTERKDPPALVLDRIREHGGLQETMHVIEGTGGRHILLIPFRFPLISEDADLQARLDRDNWPFRLFSGFLWRNELGWFYIGRWPNP